MSKDRATRYTDTGEVEVIPRGAERSDIPRDLRCEFCMAAEQGSGPGS